MPTVADLKVRFSADTKDAERGIKNIDRSIKDVAGNKGFNLGDMFNVAGGNVISGAIRDIGSALLSVGGQAFSAYADVERLSMSLETFAARELINAGAADTMGEAIAMSGERAKEMLGWIRSLATESPFNAKDIASAFRLAQAYGFTSTQAQRLTQATVDYAAGAGISGPQMDKITLALGQIQARGKLSAGEINQLSEAGINVRQILANAFGKSTAEIINMTEAGLIPADLAIEAITRSLETDFGGAAKRQAGTFSGLISSLEDIKDFSLTDFIGGTARAVQPVLQNIVDMLSNPAMKENIIAWGDAFGVYLAEKIQYVQGLLEQVSQSATFSGGLFAALGSLTGGEVQITAEGLITSVNWGDFIGVLDWQNYVTSLTWGDWVASFAWSEWVTSLRWGDLILAFDWNDVVSTFAWSDFVAILDWDDDVYTLSWGDYLTQIDWGNWVIGIQWGDYVYQLAWADFVNMFEWTGYAVGLNWGDFVGSFNWEDKVLSLQWGDYIGVFSWEKWVAVLKWDDHVYRLAWSDFVSGINWSHYVLTLNWGDFLFHFEWNTFLTQLVWGDYMITLDWRQWIFSLTWGDYIYQLDWSAYLPAFTAWTDFIAKLTWADVVTTFTDWSTYISKLTWTDIIVGVLDWATWIPALAWNEFVHTIDWAVWLGTLIWTDYISQFSWSDFVSGSLSWRDYIVSIEWKDHITESLKWSGYVVSVTWGNFVEKLEWPQFVQGLNIADWIPTFPGWGALFGGIGSGTNVAQREGNASIGGSGGYPGNAAGTDSWRGGWTWVGEKGPELLNLPKGSQIMSNAESQKMIGQLADGTTGAAPPAIWPGGSASFADNFEARVSGGLLNAGDKVATKMQRAMESAAKKLRKEMESALQGVPGLFNASQVTPQQMKLADLGVPQNFADDWLRRLTDEVVNGVQWDGVDIKDAAVRAGLDPGLPAEALLEMVTQAWNDSSLFAGGANTDLINVDAVQTALAKQAASKSGKAAIVQIFGITPEQATGQAVALGGSMRAGIETGLTTPTAGTATSAGLLGGLTNITPEQMAPVGSTIIDGLTTEIGKEEYADKIGAAFTKLFTGFLERKESLTDVGTQIMTRIVESMGTASGIDMVGRFVGAFSEKLALPESIVALHDLGAQILSFIFDGYTDAAKERDWVGGTVQLPTAAASSASTVAATSQSRSLGGFAGATAGGPIINVYATVANGIDIHQVAYQVADIVQKRSRR